MLLDKLPLVKKIPENTLVFYVLADIIDPVTEEKKTVFRTFRKETAEWFNEEGLPPTKEFELDPHIVGQMALYPDKKIIEITVVIVSLGMTKGGAAEEIRSVLKTVYPKYKFIVH
ncbi:MAG: hypothetical protein WCT49_05395 [Candidatus Paceibacterota bacterium]|jgi:hypothetical protein|nr:hypothetical protein [Candidatus Paceibacterota bacterium]